MSQPKPYLDIFRENGRRIAKIRQLVVQYSQTHFDLSEIDAYADHLITQSGGEPAFKRVPGYHWATCINLNEAIVHSIPKGHLKPGDLVTLDTGMYYQGTTTDCATSYVIGPPTVNQTHFLAVGQKALRKAIGQAKPGHRVKDISQAMQKQVERAGFSVVRTLSGHGLGATMHQEPQIPCFVSNDPNLKHVLTEGQVLAIEVMYMDGDWPLSQDQDGWTLRTADGSLSAVFEDDLIVTAAGPEVITQ